MPDQSSITDTQTGLCLKGTLQHIVVQKTEQAQTRPTFYDLVLKDSCERTFYLADTYSLFWAASVVQVYL